MYRHPTTASQQRLDDEQRHFSRSRSQYLKENWNPNNIQSQMSLLNISESSSRLKKAEKRRNSLVQEEEAKSTKKKTAGTNKNPINNMSKQRGSLTHLPMEVPYQSRHQYTVYYDFIRPEDIGMNSKAVHHQLQNAMQRQIYRQKAEIVALNATITQLKAKDKQQVSEIHRLNSLIARMEFDNMYGNRQKPHHQDDKLLAENHKLKKYLDEARYLIKKVLLERYKERMFTFHS